MQEERGWEPSEEEEDIAAIELLQRSRSADSAPDGSDDSESEDDEVLVSQEEELAEVDESAFEKLIKRALEQPMYDSAVTVTVQPKHPVLN